MSMKILNHSAVVINEYHIEHEGTTYKYREWVDSEGLKLLDSSVCDSRDRDLNPELEDELLDLFAELVNNN